MKNVQPALMMVPLAKIRIGASNPRKLFDEDAISELTASVKEKGVIQPVLLRPTDTADIYELVCGERRYRASGLAELVEIPAYIKVLTDDEALELQITENLQRKDVHPMEEAYAFKQLLERHTLQEVTARVGKKEYFVKQRMKFNDLLPLWQKVFYKNLIPASDALKIAMLPAESQERLLKDQKIDNDKVEKGHRVDINNYTLRSLRGKLSDAPFDISDADLDKNVGSCLSCKYNSACANLFPEDAKTPICSNLGCFKNKATLHFGKEIKIAMADPAMILISENYCPSDALVAKYKKEGFEVIGNNAYNTVNCNAEAEAPDWDEFKDENEDEYPTEAELQQAFDTALKQYEDQKQKTQQKIASGKYLKAFYIEGNRTGKYAYITLDRGNKPTSKADSKTRIESGKATASEIDEEIGRIRTREIRAKELDAEKVHKRIVEAVSAEKSFKEIPAAFADTDKVLIRFLASEYISYQNRDFIKKTIGINIGYDSRNKPEATYKQLEGLSDAKLAFMVRTIIFDKYNTSLPNNNGGHMIRRMAELYETIPISAYETEQKEKAEKRQKRVDGRVAELQEQKKLLKPKLETKAKAPKKNDKKRLQISDEKYITENYLLLTTKEIGKHIGCPKGTVQSFLQRKQLTVPMDIKNKKRARSIRERESQPKPGDKTILENYLTVNVNQLSIMVERSETYIKTRLKNLGLVIPPEIIEQRKIDSRIQPGNIPKNKGLKQVDYMTQEQIERTISTRFKKGEPNHNELYDGAITIRNEHPERNGGRPMQYIRLSKGIWKELHLHKWENIYGILPEKFVLACVDGNTLNSDPENWKPITMADNLQRNNYGRDNLDDKYIAMQLSKNGRKTDPELKKEFIRHPELLEVKRLEITLKRTIKKRLNEKQQSN